MESENFMIDDPIRIECPLCHKFTELKKSGGTYYGRCKHCSPGVRFSVVIIQKLRHPRHKIKQSSIRPDVKSKEQ